MKTLVIRTARLGDILQLGPMLRGIKEGDPEGELHYLVSSELKELVDGWSWIDQVIEFPLTSYRLELREKPESFRKICNEIFELAQDLKSREYHLIINRDYELGGILSALCRPEVFKGVSMDGKGRFVADEISQRLVDAVRGNRRATARNLVDWSIDIAGVSPSIRNLDMTLPVSARVGALELLRERGVRQGDLLVAVQMGAAKEFRRWGAENFAELIEWLMTIRRRKVVLVGTMSEMDLRDEILGRVSFRDGQLVDVVGKTSIKELAAVLERCSYLITGDTGTMHVAAAVGTKVIAMFYGPAYPFETGPYGEGHLVLMADLPCAPCRAPSECTDHFRCRDLMTPRKVRDVILFAERAFGLSDEDVPVPSWEHVSCLTTEVTASGLRMVELCGQEAVERYCRIVEKVSGEERERGSYNRIEWLQGLLEESIRLGDLARRDFHLNRNEQGWSACSRIFSVLIHFLNLLRDPLFPGSRGDAVDTGNAVQGLLPVLETLQRNLLNRDVVGICDAIRWELIPLASKISGELK